MATPPVRLIPTALTTLGAVAAWLNQPSTQPLSDQQTLELTNLINADSRAILAYCSRSFTLLTKTLTPRGMDTCEMLLPEWPVLAINSLTIGNVTIPVQPSYGQQGYILDAWDGQTPGDPQRLSLIGYSFPRTPGAIQINLTTGYATLGEVQTVDSTGLVWPLAPQGRFSANWKVLDATGATMAAVSGTPSVGQYNAPTSDQTPYTFNPAQGTVTLNYTFIPSEVEFCCTKWVCEQFRYSGRIGQRSRSTGPTGTDSFIIEAMPADVKLILNNYSKKITN